MDSSRKYNIDSYTIEEMLKLVELSIDDELDEEDVTAQFDEYINHFNEIEPDRKMADFLSTVKVRVLENLSFDSDSENSVVAMPGYNKGQQYDLNKEEVNEEQKWIESEDSVKINKNEKAIMHQDLNLTPGVHSKPVVKDILNPNLKNMNVKMLNIDSQYRQLIRGNSSGSTDFYLDLNEPLTNVLHMRLYSLQLPVTWYVFDSAYGTNVFWINTQMIEIENGNYTAQELVSHINEKINTYDALNGKVMFTYSHNNGKMKITCVTDIYSVVFFDTANVAMKVNNNLGWILGFREIFYMNTDNKAWSIQAEAIADLYGPKYLLIYLDDFNQNHLNNSLVSNMDTTDINLGQAPYFNRDLNVIYSDDGLAQVYAETDRPRTITQAQLFRINKVLQEKKEYSTNIRTTAPSNTNVFGYIPIKKGGIAIGESFIEMGGSMQSNVRNYFGPVNISRMHVKLIDDKGNTVNLNGCDWSFGVICETLYQY
jgi:hypothetical protein